MGSSQTRSEVCLLYSFSSPPRPSIPRNMEGLASRPMPHNLLTRHVVSFFPEEPLNRETRHGSPHILGKRVTGTAFSEARTEDTYRRKGRRSPPTDTVYHQQLSFFFFTESRGETKERKEIGNDHSRRHRPGGPLSCSL